MAIDYENSSKWLRDLDLQLRKGRGVILHGNVADQFNIVQDGGASFGGLWELLRRYSDEEEFDVLMRYDQVDGLRFADDATMRRQYEALVGPARGGEAQAQQRALTQIQGAVRDLRSALANTTSRLMAVVDFAGQLAGDAERQHELEERNLFLSLLKATAEAACVEGRRNALVIVAADLRLVPLWLYRDNPHVELVRVRRPDRDERRAFFMRTFERLHGAREVSGRRDELCGVLSDLTDGSMLWDLEALTRTSQIEEMKVAQPQQLVDRHQHGQREDPWLALEDKAREARDVLVEKVLGQDRVIDRVVDALYTATGGLSMSHTFGRTRRPKAVFFFVGPTGVGKTELARAICQLIFGDSEAYARFDMSEYREEHAAERLTGAPPGYVGYSEGGQLTNRLQERPFSLLLFDEIEKAHSSVLDKFLQVLEDGRLTDGRGQTAYFSQAVIVFTSNIGADSLSQGEIDQERVQSHFATAVGNHFVNVLRRPELLNRLGQNILTFDILRPGVIDQIARKFLDALRVSAVEDRRRLRLDLDEPAFLEEIRRRMSEPENRAMGGRQIKNLLERILEQPLNRWVVEQGPALRVGSTVRASLEDGQARFNRR